MLTERKDHLNYLQKRFSRFAKNIVVLWGGMSAKDRKIARAALTVADNEERLIRATGRYIGEGFDDARLDTLFLTMPIAWKGTLVQYVGGCTGSMARRKMFWWSTMSTVQSLCLPGWLRNDELGIVRSDTRWNRL